MRRFFYSALAAALLAGSGANAMNYGLLPFQDGTTAIVAQGTIGSNEIDRFASALHSARASGASPRTLILSSRGGDLQSALLLGLAVRQLGMRTMVASVAQAPDGQRTLAAAGCHSACVLLLMAGTDRSVLPGSLVGVHSPKLVVRMDGANYTVDEQTTRAIVVRNEPLLRRYASVMGVNPALIGVAHAVPHSRIRTLTSSELSRYRLVTSGSARRSAQKPGRRTATVRRKRGAS